MREEREGRRETGEEKREKGETKERREKGECQREKEKGDGRRTKEGTRTKEERAREQDKIWKKEYRRGKKD